MRAADKMPHALLLAGPRYLGKRAFAVATAAYLLCRDPAEGACGHCDNCQLVAAGTHPDLRILEPEESKLILVDQVRSLIDWANQTAQRAGYKVVIVQPAERMNVNSANALLKCLEEPPKDTVFILISDLPGRLLPTIRSRCQAMPFDIPSSNDARRWLDSQSMESTNTDLMLSIAGGSPLRVVEELDEEYLSRRQEIAGHLAQLLEGGNPLGIASSYIRVDAARDLALIHGIVMDALKRKFSAGDKHIKNKDLNRLLNLICDSVSSSDLFAFLDLVVTERQAVAGQSNPNTQFVFEGLFVRLREFSHA
jgi:DNA polymerase-3 subunit delta'